MFILLSVVGLVALMAAFCLITHRFTKGDLDKFDTITMLFMASLTGVMAVIYRITYSIQLSYNYKDGVEEGFTRNIVELFSMIPQAAYKEDWVGLFGWGFVGFAIAVLIQMCITMCVTQIWVETSGILEEGEEFDFSKHYCEKIMLVTTGICVAVLALIMSVFGYKESFLSHEDYSAYDMSKKIEVSEDLVSAISRQCEGMNVATIIRNRIYCEEQVGDMYYVLSESVTFYDHDMGEAINLYQENGINSDPMSNLEHMFVLTWDRKTISDRSLFFMVRKDIDPPKLDPSSISSWGTRYFKNLEKLIPQMPEEENAVIKADSPFGDEWSELEVSLDK